MLDSASPKTLGKTKRRKGIQTRVGWARALSTKTQQRFLPLFSPPPPSSPSKPHLRNAALSATVHALGLAASLAVPPVVARHTASCSCGKRCPRSLVSTSDADPTPADSHAYSHAAGGRRGGARSAGTSATAGAAASTTASAAAAYSDPGAAAATTAAHSADAGTCCAAGDTGSRAAALSSRHLLGHAELVLGGDKKKRAGQGRAAQRRAGQGLEGREESVKNACGCCCDVALPGATRFVVTRVGAIHGVLILIVYVMTQARSCFVVVFHRALGANSSPFPP